MSTVTSATRIAVIGIGPRGLGALEALAELLVQHDRAVSVDLFDPFHAPGAGPNFDPDESPLCLLNIPVRDIDIRPPSFSRCGRYVDWLNSQPDPDSFPSRASLGRYLEARFGDLAAVDALSITRIAEKVEGVQRGADGWQVLVRGHWHSPYDEVLLTLGQPAVTPDQQLSDWIEHATRAACEIAEAYPANRLARTAADWTGKTVGIRGLGLSTFDVVRVLTLAQGGEFRDGKYVASGREPARILPFSLDGKPPFPKPATGALDDRFTPQAHETADFSAAMARASTQTPDAAKDQIIAALVPAVTRILAQHGTGEDARDCTDWLQTEWTSPGTQEKDGPLDTLHAGIELAEGTRPPTIGYVVGQLWRKWQNEIRAGFNSAQTPTDTARALIDFDEGLKRYSYGPPVSAARELAALVAAGVVDLDLATDPDIDLTDAGWTLCTDGKTARVDVMINAVIPAPDLSSVTGDLVSALIAQDRLVPLAKGLAASTTAEASLIDKTNTPVPSLCLLGRLAHGSVIAVDSLHDCFGDSASRWASGVLKRIG